MRVLCCGETRQQTCSFSAWRRAYIVHRLDLRPGQHQAARGQNADLAGDRFGGVLVVAGDHDGLEAGAVRHANRFHRLRARRVDHAQQADEGELLLERFGRRVVGHRVERAAGDAEHAQRVARHVAVLVEHFTALLGFEPDHLAVFPYMGAKIEDDIGAPLTNAKRRYRPCE